MAKNERETAVFTAYDDHEPIDPAMPERNLLRAVLLSAMADLNKDGEPREKALEYFLSPDEEHIFSFQSVCLLLGIEPSTILILNGLQKPEVERTLGPGVGNKPKPESPQGRKNQP